MCYALLAVATLSTTGGHTASTYSVQDYRIGEAANPGPNCSDAADLRDAVSNVGGASCTSTTANDTSAGRNGRSWLDDPEGPDWYDSDYMDCYPPVDHDETAFDEPPQEDEEHAAAIPRGVPPATPILPDTSGGTREDHISCKKYSGHRQGFYFGTVGGSTGYYRDTPKVAVLRLHDLINHADVLNVPISLAEGLGLPAPTHGNMTAAGTEPRTAARGRTAAETAERRTPTLHVGSST